MSVLYSVPEEVDNSREALQGDGRPFLASVMVNNPPAGSRRPTLHRTGGCERSHSIRSLPGDLHKPVRIMEHNVQTEGQPFVASVMVDHSSADKFDRRKPTLRFVGGCERSDSIRSLPGDLYREVPYRGNREIRLSRPIVDSAAIAPDLFWEPHHYAHRDDRRGKPSSVYSLPVLRTFSPGRHLDEHDYDTRSLQLPRREFRAAFGNKHIYRGDNGYSESRSSVQSLPVTFSKPVVSNRSSVHGGEHSSEALPAIFLEDKGYVPTVESSVYPVKQNKNIDYQHQVEKEPSLPLKRRCLCTPCVVILVVIVLMLLVALTFITTVAFSHSAVRTYSNTMSRKHPYNLTTLQRVGSRGSGDPRPRPGGTRLVYPQYSQPDPYREEYYPDEPYRTMLVNSGSHPGPGVVYYTMDIGKPGSDHLGPKSRHFSGENGKPNGSYTFRERRRSISTSEKQESRSCCCCCRMLAWTILLAVALVCVAVALVVVCTLSYSKINGVTTSKDLIDSLGLEEIPNKGGWFKATWRATAKMSSAGAEKATGSATYYMLRDRDITEWRRLSSDEVWFYHCGDNVVIHTLSHSTVNKHTTYILGDHAVDTRAQFQMPISRYTWFAAELVNKDSGSYALMSVVSSPGYDPQEVVYGNRTYLSTLFPDAESQTFIRKLTRN